MAGERAGNLDAVLRRFVAYSKTIDTVRSKTISAMIYPVILVALAVVLVGIIVIKVVPTFAEFYGSFDAQLPLSTRMIVAVSDFIRAQFWLIADRDRRRGGRRSTRGSSSRAAARSSIAWMLKLPVVGGSFHKFSTSQMARTLATLLGGGIPLVNALEIAARSTGNRHMGKELEIVVVAGARRPGLRQHAARAADRARRGDQDDRGRRVDRRADRNAQQPRGFLRRGN